MEWTRRVIAMINCGNYAPVIPAKAGIQVCEVWIPAFTGMTTLCRLSSYKL